MMILFTLEAVSLLFVLDEELARGEIVALPVGIEYCGGFCTLFRHIFKFSNKFYLSFCFFEQAGHESFIFVVLNDNELATSHTHCAPKAIH